MRVQGAVVVVGIQLLVVVTQPGDVVAQQHAVDCQPPAAAVPLHRHLRAARNAAVRRQVQLCRHPRQATVQLRHLLGLTAHRLSGHA